MDIINSVIAMDVPLILILAVLHISLGISFLVVIRCCVDRRLGLNQMEKNAQDFTLDRLNTPESQPSITNPNTPTKDSCAECTDMSDVECCICGATIVKRVTNYSLPEAPADLTCFFCKNPVEIDKDIDSEYENDSEYIPEPAKINKVWSRGPARLRRIEETDTDIWLDLVSDSEDEHIN